MLQNVKKNWTLRPLLPFDAEGGRKYFVLNRFLVAGAGLQAALLLRKSGFCLFGGNALLPFQKCPPISLDKMPLFRIPFLKGHFEKEHFVKEYRRAFLKEKKGISHLLSQNVLLYNFTKCSYSNCPSLKGHFE